MERLEAVKCRNLKRDETTRIVYNPPPMCVDVARMIVGSMAHGLLITSWVIGASAACGAQVDPNWTAAIRSDVTGFPGRVIDDSRATFLNGGNAAILLGTGAASLVMHTEGLDQHIAHHFESHDTFGQSGDRFLFNVGSPFAHLPAAGLWYGLSVAGGDDLNRERSLTMLSALGITDVVAFGFKSLLRDERPNGNKGSFPSSHTASSFAVASVLHEYYGWRVGVPAYAVAGMVGWRMMDAGDHWASDILFGAALGCVVGHSVAGHHNPIEQAGFELAPYFGDAETPAAGISLVKRF
jgi:membrane-associated phospholipid phosphatase